MKRLFLLFILLLVSISAALAQKKLAGSVVDAKTGEKIPFVYVVYVNGGGTQTDLNGNFSLPFKAGRLRLSVLGYETKTVTVKECADSLVFKLKSMDRSLNTAEVVVGKKAKYSRKNNPAVELMSKVIAAKRQSDLHHHDYYSIDKYSKITFAFNEVTDKIFEDGKFKKFPFLKDHVEVCNETGKLILPISVDETVTRMIYRKDPKSEKNIILGQRSNGINDLLNTGDIVTTMLKDCFTDVDIYQDEVRLLQYPFTSPISSRTAISFYRYFIVDTLQVSGNKCIQVDFTPNNAQDFGFSGSLYIMADSTYRVHSVDMGIPVRSDVNFVESMRIMQEFKQLPTGEQVLAKDDMLVQIKLAKFLNKFQVKRATEYSNFSFEPIPDKTFKFKGETLTAANAQMQDKEFWQTHRADSLTKSESSMDQLIHKLEQVKGFKPVLWIAKAFIENFVETTVNPDKPSKVDIGPVNTMITQNFVDGLRLRLSAQTTANFNKHLFLKGYAAYGFKDEKWKGMGEVTYSFNKKAYLPREFPVNNLTFNYTRDVMSPSDKFLPTDKDNVFTSFKWKKVDHMMYFETYKLLWDREWANGLRFTLQARTSKDSPTASLFYQPLCSEGISQDASLYMPYIRTYDGMVGLRFQPGVTWINTKQRRIASNNDAPIFTLNHTAGVYNFGKGTDNNMYNFTEASIYKRFWLASWGKMDVTVKGGVQWNKVPYPLLIMPAANLSYIMEDNTFNLIDNMEFLNDRYVSLMYSWDLNGKIFNRIPLIKKLKWREYIGCNVLWGTLTSKNNPYLAKNANDSRLLYFPGNWKQEGFVTQSHIMNSKRPYVEVVAGIHNIFKIFHIEYVQRLNYIEPGTQKWGIRGMFRLTF